MSPSEADPSPTPERKQRSSVEPLVADTAAAAAVPSSPGVGTGTPGGGARKRGRARSESGKSTTSSRPSSSASGKLGTIREPTRKKGRISEEEPLKLDFRHHRGSGYVLTVGQGDTGQLGLGEDVMEKSRPQVVAGISSAVDVAAGGMHTAVLDIEGTVHTFGCNDEGSLGRLVEEEEECFLPGKVDLPGRIVQICCGDSHTAALTDQGEVWAWGTFRDSSGPIGLVTSGELQKVPVKVLPGVRVVKIASGSDHLVMLTTEGELYSMGNAEQGQLGRIMEKFSHRGGRRGVDTFLKPDKIHVKHKYGAFLKVWAGSYNTIALTASGHVMVCGLNNYNQLGVAEGLTFYMPVVSSNLGSHSPLDTVAIGQHHSLALTQSGGVLAIGRSEYGRLGLGEGRGDAVQAAPLDTIEEDCLEVACGTAVSYAVTKSGKLFSWGMGTNGQLGTGEEDDVWEPGHCNTKQLRDRAVIAVSSGGQHTVMIAKDKPTENGLSNGMDTT